jgi:hypothetical protein
LDVAIYETLLRAGHKCAGADAISHEGCFVVPIIHPGKRRQIEGKRTCPPVGDTRSHTFRLGTFCSFCTLHVPSSRTQDVFVFLYAHDLAAASMTCHAWRTAACTMVTHLTLPLNHPLLVSGPAPGWAELVERVYGHPGAQQRLTSHRAGFDAGGAGSSAAAATGSKANGHEASTPGKPGGSGGAGSSMQTEAQTGRTAAALGTPTTPGAAGLAGASIPQATSAPGGSPLAVPPLRGTPLPRLRTDFPKVTHITLVHNAMLHRAQVHAAMSTLRALWPSVRGLSVHDSVTWDLPLDYSALGVMTHITSLVGLGKAGGAVYGLD